MRLKRNHDPRKEITFVNPSPRPPFLKKYSSVPLSILTLISLTPSNTYRIKVINRIKNWKFQKTDLVCITVVTAWADYAYKLSEIYREQGVKVIFGGIFPSLVPQEAIKHADTIVIGDAENIWSRILKDFENNNLKKIYRGTPAKDLNVKIRRPKPFMYGGFINLIQTTRGCPNKCDF